MSKRVTSIATLGTVTALSLGLWAPVAFAAGRGPGTGGHGGAVEGPGGSGKSVSMTPTSSAPSGSAATIGWTVSRGFGSATLRVSATGLPLPTTTCDVPYSVHLSGTSLTDPPQSAPTSIDTIGAMSVAGTTPPTCSLVDGVATWTVNGSPVTTSEFGFNQDFPTGFTGSAAIVNSSGTDLFTYSGVELPVRVNSHKRGTGD